MAAPVLQDVTTPKRYRFTVEQYYQMAEAGILGPDERVELIEGEIVEMAAIGPTHAWLVANLNRAVFRQIGDDVRLDLQNPIHLGPRTEPQPDLCLSRYYPGQSAHPAPEDIHFVVEVSDSTLDYDRNTKPPLYAAVGIAESWLVDVAAWTLERHTEPHHCVYQQVDRAVRGQSLASPLALKLFSLCMTFCAECLVSPLPLCFAQYFPLSSRAGTHRGGCGAAAAAG
jgi:Uma2 family endonuclease